MVPKVFLLDLEAFLAQIYGSPFFYFKGSGPIGINDWSKSYSVIVGHSF
jgi:hypothetical protein